VCGGDRGHNLSLPASSPSMPDEAPIKLPDYFRKMHCEGKVNSDDCPCTRSIVSLFNDILVYDLGGMAGLIYCRREFILGFIRFIHCFISLSLVS